MTISKISIALFGAALLFASSVLAGDVNKGILNISEKVTVDGKPLAPGIYKLEWNGTGPEVQVTLHQGKQTVATFAAHVTEQTSQNTENAYGSVTQPDGSRALTSIYLGGKHTVIQIDRNGPTQQSSAQGAK